MPAVRTKLHLKDRPFLTHSVA